MKKNMHMLWASRKNCSEYRNAFTPNATRNSWLLSKRLPCSHHCRVCCMPETADI